MQQKCKFPMPSRLNMELTARARVSSHYDPGSFKRDVAGCCIVYVSHFDNFYIKKTNAIEKFDISFTLYPLLFSH